MVLQTSAESVSVDQATNLLQLERVVKLKSDRQLTWVSIPVGTMRIQLSTPTTMFSRARHSHEN